MTQKSLRQTLAAGAALAAIGPLWLGVASAQGNATPAPPPIRWGTAAPAPMPAAVPPAVYSTPRPQAPPPVQPGTPARSPALPSALPAAGPAANAGRVLRLPLAAQQPLSGAALEEANQRLLASLPNEAASPGLPARGTSVPAGTSPGLGGPAGRVQSAGTASAGQVDPAVVRAACSAKGRINGASGNITPGGLVLLQGCELGFARGQVRMGGAFAGGYVTLGVKVWRNDLVVAEVPAGLEGVLDQPVKISLVMADQRISNEQPAAFQARRVTMPIAGELVRITNCARPQPSDCLAHQGADRATLVGYHRGSDSQGGTDSYAFVLGNHWQLERVELNNAKGEVRVLRAASGVDVQWQSRELSPSDILFSPGLFMARYELRPFAVGPAGVPMVGTAN